jgi:Ni/Co efflux regulator RcnB
MFAVTLGLLLAVSATVSADEDGPRGWRDDGGARVNRSEARDERRETSVAESRGQNRSAEARVETRTVEAQVENRSVERSRGERGNQNETQVFNRQDWPRNEPNTRSERNATYVNGVPGNDGRGRGRVDNNRGNENRWGNDRNRGNDNRYRDNGRRDERSWRDNNRGRDWGNSRGHRDWSRRGWDRNQWRRSWTHGWGGNRYRSPSRYYYPRGYARFAWNIGVRLPAAYYASNYYVDYRSYGLATPPYGCSWVRIDDDLLLVDLDTGEVLDALYGFYY